MQTLIKPKHVALVTKYMLCSKNGFIGCYVSTQRDEQRTVDSM